MVLLLGRKIIKEVTTTEDRVTITVAENQPEGPRPHIRFYTDKESEPKDLPSPPQNRVQNAVLKLAPREFRNIHHIVIRGGSLGYTSAVANDTDNCVERELNKSPGSCKLYLHPKKPRLSVIKTTRGPGPLHIWLLNEAVLRLLELLHDS
ncbi:hypothetical protein E5288_WYG004878 [Bos mutus]|uniref:Uncharacterized protein n=1 Tax=Bos mutus TaxID=72004 RepID=A0A6B0R079_9CETA|nr:hypothetical protein [Bos mutus]